MDNERVLHDREYRHEQIRKTEIQFFWVATIGTPFVVFFLGWAVLPVLLGVGLFCSMVSYSSPNPFRTYRSMWALYKKGFVRVRDSLVKQ
jgi:hypothetical protein